MATHRRADLRDRPRSAPAGEAFAWEALDRCAQGQDGARDRVLRSSERKAWQRDALLTPTTAHGRARVELAAIVARLDECFAGAGRIVGISAEAGMGKSRLSAEFLRIAPRTRRPVAVGECQAFGTNTAYFVWREICMRLLDLDDAMPAAAQIDALQPRLAAIDPHAERRGCRCSTPCLDLPIADNDLTASFDAKLRKTSLEGLLTECLRARARNATARARARGLPLARSALTRPANRSRARLRRPARAAAPCVPPAHRRRRFTGRRVAGRLHRSRADRARPRCRRRARSREARADPASRRRAAARTGRADHRRAPRAIRSTSRSCSTSFAAKASTSATTPRSEELDLPESLHSLILSRIDALSEAPRRTLKVASVLGRVFRAPVLPASIRSSAPRWIVDQHSQRWQAWTSSPSTRQKKARGCSSTS